MKGEKWIFVARIDYSLNQIYFQQELIISIRILLLQLLLLLLLLLLLVPVPVVYQQCKLCICIELHLSCPKNNTVVSTVITPFIQKTDYSWKKLSQDNKKTVMLIGCLKQLKDFIFKFSISGSFFLQKAFLNQYIVILVSFPSGGCVDEVVCN